MSARRQIIAALSEDSLGGIATLQDVAHAEQLVDAHAAEVLRQAERELGAHARHGGPRERGLAFAQGVLLALADGAPTQAGENAILAGTTATPDFFELGHAYRRNSTEFRCKVLDPSPTTGERRAIGWQFSPVNGVHLWHVTALDPDDWAHGGWTDTTDTLNARKDGRS